MQELPSHIAFVETMLYFKGRLPLALLHVERMRHSLGKLGLAPPQNLNATQIAAWAAQACAVQGYHTTARVRLLAAIEDNRVSLDLEVWPLEEGLVGWNDKGLHIGVASATKVPGPLANCKQPGLLCYAQAREEAAVQHWDDALLPNPVGYLVETSIANVFWVKDSVVYTPPLTDGCVAGVARNVLIQAARDAGYTCIEKSLTPAELLTATAVLLTNALRGPRWVQAFQTTTYSNTIAKRLTGCYWEWVWKRDS